ncbi:MAG: histidine kinase N-terminal 7TM domain-containing protein, partial [Chloroflexota bacterium]
MHWQYSPYIIPQLISTLISASVAVLAWRRRTVPGAAALAVIMLGISQWSLATTLQWASADLAAQLFWFKFRFFGTELLSLMYLVMALQYTGHSQRLTRRNMALLVVLPLLSLGALWTNDAHHLFFTSAQLVQSGSFVALDVEFGPWFWLHTAYDYLLLTSALLIFLRTLLRSPQFYRAQLAAIMLSAVMPLSANILFVSNLSPFPYLDLTPLFFTLTGITYLVGFFRLHMWDITPAAR